MEEIEWKEIYEVENEKISWADGMWGYCQVYHTHFGTSSQPYRQQNALTLIIEAFTGLKETILSCQLLLPHIRARKRRMESFHRKYRIVSLRNQQRAPVP